MTAVVAFASAIDAGRFGEHRSEPRGRARFGARIGSADHPAQAERYHLYGSWSCPASHRLAILRGLAGLDDIVSMSYVDGLRDGRGWAFRPDTGPDPVNGFTLLAEAYERSEPSYLASGGPVTVPVLWDREAARIVSTEPASIGLDLATRFGGASDIYPVRHVAEIDQATAMIAAEIEQVMGRAVYRPAAARSLLHTLAALDRSLSSRSFLVGNRLTDADIRLWVLLVRYDAGPNAFGAVGPRLDAFPSLWRWATALYARDAFRRCTDFGRFAARPAELPPWHGSVSSATGD